MIPLALAGIGFLLLLGSGGSHQVTAAADYTRAGSVAVAAGPKSSATSTGVLQKGVTYRLVITGTARWAAGPDYTDSDAMYCFAGSSGACSTPRPDGDLVFGFQRTDSRPPAKNMYEFQDGGGSGPLPAYTSTHRYQIRVTPAADGRLYIESYPTGDEGDGEYSGRFTVDFYAETEAPGTPTGWDGSVTKQVAAPRPGAHRTLQSPRIPAGLKKATVSVKGAGPGVVVGEGSSDRRSGELFNLLVSCIIHQAAQGRTTKLRVAKTVRVNGRELRVEEFEEMEDELSGVELCFFLIFEFADSGTASSAATGGCRPGAVHLRLREQRDGGIGVRRTRTRPRGAPRYRCTRNATGVTTISVSARGGLRRRLGRRWDLGIATPRGAKPPSGKVRFTFRAG